MVTLPHAKYFQGILQLRNHTPELRRFVYNTTKHDGKALIVQEKKVRGGLDLYFSSQAYLQALGKKIKARFPGILTVTATLHTRSKMGKELYRITVLFRYLNFHTHDTIGVHGKPHKILRIGENRVQLQDVSSGKKHWMPLKDIERILH